VPTLRNSLAGADIAHHLHPRTNWRTHEATGPMIVNRGEGAEIEDESGRRYIEGMAGLWCASLGFNHPRLAKAGAAQLDKLAFYHTFAHRSPDITVDLAARLGELAPNGLRRVCFNTSGSEATETMVKFAWAYHAARGEPLRRKVISRNRGFHGSTIVAASMSGLPDMHREYGLPLPGFIHVRCPDLYREGAPGESEAAFAQRLATELEATIALEGPETIAAFIAEPILAGGGVVVPPADYFRNVQAVLDQHGILMLDDEVVCGFGRTGNWFGCETVGMRPDMMAVAKALSSSYFPISATLISDQIYEVLADNHAGAVFGHGFTNSGHPVGAAIALETLDVYHDLDLIPLVRRKGARLKEGLLRRIGNHPFVGEIRGCGLIMGLELAADPAARRGFPASFNSAARVNAAALERGLALRSMMGDILGICPPYIITDQQIDALVDRLALALDDVTPALREAAGA
jgi:4-aminobutyrate--pyruvate transaminase